MLDVQVGDERNNVAVRSANPLRSWASHWSTIPSKLIEHLLRTTLGEAILICDEIQLLLLMP